MIILIKMHEYISGRSHKESTLLQVRSSQLLALCAYVGTKHFIFELVDSEIN